MKEVVWNAELQSVNVSSTRTDKLFTRFVESGSEDDEQEVLPRRASDCFGYE